MNISGWGMLSAAGFHVKINTQGIFFDCGIFFDVKKKWTFFITYGFNDTYQNINYKI